MKKAILFFFFSVLVFWFASQAHAVEISESSASVSTGLSSFDIRNNAPNEKLTGSLQEFFDPYEIMWTNEYEGAWWHKTNGNSSYSEMFDPAVELYGVSDYPGDGNHRIMKLAFKGNSLQGNDSAPFSTAASRTLSDLATMLPLGFGLIWLGSFRRKYIR